MPNQIPQQYQEEQNKPHFDLEQQNSQEQTLSLEEKKSIKIRLQASTYSQMTKALQTSKTLFKKLIKIQPIPQKQIMTRTLLDPDQDQEQSTNNVNAKSNQNQLNADIIDQKQLLHDQLQLIQNAKKRKRLSWSPGIMIQNYNPNQNITQGQPFTEIYYHKYLPEEIDEEADIENNNYNQDEEDEDQDEDNLNQKSLRYEDDSQSQNQQLNKQKYQKMLLTQQQELNNTSYNQSMNQTQFGGGADQTFFQRQASLVYMIFMANFLFIVFLTLFYMKLAFREKLEVISMNHVFIPLEAFVMVLYAIMSGIQVQEWLINSTMNLILTLLLLATCLSIIISLIFLGLYLSSQIYAFSYVMIPIYITLSCFTLFYVYALPGLIMQSLRATFLSGLHLLSLITLFMLIDAKYGHQVKFIESQMCLIPVLLANAIHLISSLTQYYSMRRNKNQKYTNIQISSKQTLKTEIIVTTLILIEFTLISMYLEGNLKQVGILFIPIIIGFVIQLKKFIDAVGEYDLDE
eukprot:403334423